MDGWTCCGCAAVAGATVNGPCHVRPPFGETSTRMKDREPGSPKIGLVDELRTMKTLPPATTVVGWVISLVAFLNTGRPKRPPPRLGPWCRTVRNPPVTPQSARVPGVTFGNAVGSATPGTLKLLKWNVSPPSSEISTLMKSASASPPCRNGTNRRPVRGSTIGFENWMNADSTPLSTGAKSVLVVHVWPPSVDRPSMSWDEAALKLVQ